MVSRMEERYILTDFTVDIPFEQVIRELRLADGEDIDFVRPLYENAMRLARPKALYKICYVDAIQGDRVTIDGTDFHSQVLAKNLTDIHRVFAYVTTCGHEVDDWAAQETDYITVIWLDMLKGMILAETQKQFLQQIKTLYRIEKLSSMNPGSGNLDTWPIAQQAGLFSLIGQVSEDISVRLTDSMLMLPNKSVSGILFPSEKGYTNCALCRRDPCQNRRAPYDESLMQKL